MKHTCCHFSNIDVVFSVFHYSPCKSGCSLLSYKAFQLFEFMDMINIQPPSARSAASPTILDVEKAKIVTGARLNFVLGTLHVFAGIVVMIADSPL